jgi:hypothetical protein
MRMRPRISADTAKNFDAVAIMRPIRHKVSVDIEGITLEQAYRNESCSRVSDSSATPRPHHMY